MKYINLMKGSFVIVFSIIMAYSTGIAKERPYSFSMPSGWTQDSPGGTIASSWSPDKKVQVKIHERNANNATAVQYLKTLLSQVKPLAVINPPADAASMATRFGADSVAKMQLKMKRAKDDMEYSWRVFVFVKNNLLVVVEAMATEDAPEKYFNQANTVIGSFKFN